MICLVPARAQGSSHLVAAPILGVLYLLSAFLRLQRSCLPRSFQVGVEQRCGEVACEGAGVAPQQIPSLSSGRLLLRPRSLVGMCGAWATLVRMRFCAPGGGAVARQSVVAKSPRSLLAGWPGAES